MAFIIEWIKQIILFVLLAIIIDLLLPSNKMRKYIQLVVGLMIILMFLKPLFTVIQANIPETIRMHMNKMSLDTDEDSMNNLINLQKTDIQASTDAYILEEMAKQLIHEAETPLAEEHGVEITEILFYFRQNEERTYDSLEMIEVFVQAYGGDLEEVDSIVEVEEVIIHPNKRPEQPEVDVEPIIETLRSVWEVRDKDIQLTWGE